MSLRISGLAKSFGTVRALADIELDVPAGSLTALLGPSGCGKTTLLRTIAGFEVPDAGRIYLRGEDVTDVPLGARDIGFVFQNYALFPHLCVADNVAFGLAVRGVAKSERNARVRDLLELVRLPGFERRLPHQLSGGQRQRVALARALAAKPAFLLLDEPFAALDSTVRKELRRWLRSLHEQTHVTTLLVTHDADEAMDIADRIVLMRAGRVLQTGSPSQLYSEPQTPFVMRFFGDSNAVRSDGLLRYVRPHDVLVERAPFEGSLAANAERIVDLGSRSQVDFQFENGDRIVAELPEARAAELRLSAGTTYHLAFERSQTFAAHLEREVPA